VRVLALIAIAAALWAPLFEGALPSGSADPRNAVAAARSLFARYTALEQQFDPAIADLYSDQAVITNKRTYPTGEVRTLTFPAVQYKELIRRAMPLAKARGDTNRYSGCAYTPEGAGVRIKCTRTSVLKQYDTPISLLVAPEADGWVIREELSESRP
jgi:hypothetical protein